MTIDRPIISARHSNCSGPPRRARSHARLAEAELEQLGSSAARQREYANHTEAKLDIAAYIVGFYNSERLHLVLGTLPPSVYERNIAAKPIVVSEFTCPPQAEPRMLLSRLTYEAFSVDATYEKVRSSGTRF